jgi:cardiolipin synthase
MRAHAVHAVDRVPRDPLRSFAEQAFSRAAGAPLVGGNSVRLLRDAAENYPAWLGAIRGARRNVLFEAYILSDDAIGREFVEALRERVRAGVHVRLLYDWLGSIGEGTSRLVAPLADDGAEVRCFNPPRLDSPLAWLHRDHRKSIVVDGEVGYVTGLCIARRWVGEGSRAPWRDTGVEVRGPAVADLARAFAQVWAETGAPIAEEELPLPASIGPAGDVPVRVVATAPSTTGVYRLDHLIGALARRTLWLTDAYFVGTASYVQALRAAAMDGVDVRFLVPGQSDVAWVKPLSRAGYRPLLEAGVRVFEWNGPMLHAKTSVADGRWARVGSSNLNLSSWMGNHELDLAVEHEGFAREMEETYLADLEHSTEIVLGVRRARRPRPAPPRPVRTRGERRASSGLAAAGALRLGHTVGAALGGYRVLGPAEATPVGIAAVAVFALSVLALWFPVIAALPLGVLGLWLAFALFLKALKLRARARQEPEPKPGPDPGPGSA